MPRARALAVAEYNRALEDPNSLMVTLEPLQGCLNWLAYIPDGEMSDQDLARLRTAARQFYAVARPLVIRYIDGDET